MTETQKVLILLRKTLIEQRMSLSEHLADGSATSYDAYRDTCGKIYGLSVAVQEIQDLLDRLERNDD